MYVQNCWMELTGKSVEMQWFAVFNDRIRILKKREKRACHKAKKTTTVGSFKMKQNTYFKQKVVHCPWWDKELNTCHRWSMADILNSMAEQGCRPLWLLFSPSWAMKSQGQCFSLMVPFSLQTTLSNFVAKNRVERKY